MNRTNGRMTARGKVDQMIKGKSRKGQIDVLREYITGSKNGHGAELDVYVEAINRKLSLENNGLSKKAEKHKPDSEGIKKAGELLSAKIALGMAGC